MPNPVLIHRTFANANASGAVLGPPVLWLEQALNDDYFSGATYAQNIQNTSGVPLTIYKTSIYVSPTGTNGTAIGQVRTNSQPTTGVQYGGDSGVTSYVGGSGLQYLDMVWSSNYPVIPANTDFYIVFARTSAPASGFNVQAKYVHPGGPYAGTSYGLFVTTDPTPAADYDMRFRIYVFS